MVSSEMPAVDLQPQAVAVAPRAPPDLGQHLVHERLPPNPARRS
jgi:hypothetical protein